MPTPYGSYSGFDLQFDTTGNVVDPTAQGALTSWLASADGQSTTDLIFLSHGWNNDIGEARLLYNHFFSAMTQVQQSTGVASQRKFAVAAVFWPSKRFADADLIPGGAAALPPSIETQLNAQLDQLKVIVAGNEGSAVFIEHARAQIANLDVSQSAQNDFVFALMQALPAPRGEKDEGLDDAMSALKAGTVQGHDVLQRLSAPLLPPFPPPGGGGFIGHALGLGGIVDGIKGAASRLANLFTYYTMKDRAAIVGRTGVLASVLDVQAKFPALRIHLIGHSFGGRLVTAVANALPAPATVASLLLLEAAYSHNGLARNWDGEGHDGAFRPVIAAPRIAGPTLITHSVHDTAVGLAYPLASRIMNQVAAALGDANDKFGGMGRNGAQHTPEAFDDVLKPVGAAYAPLPAGKTIRNLNGDGPSPAPTIESHSDVAKPEICWAWLSSL